MITLADERDRDPLRAQVPAGVRVSAHGAVDPAGLAREPGEGRRLPRADLALHGRRLGMLGAAALRRRRGRLRRAELGLPHELPVARSRRRPGIESALMGTLWLMAVCAALHRPGGGRDRDLPRGVRGPRPLVEPLHRGEHPEPRRGPVDRLRHPRPGVPRARAARARPGRARRRAHARPARAARRDHRRRARRSARCRRRSARARWRSARRSGRPSASRCCPAAIPASRPA